MNHNITIVATERDIRGDFNSSFLDMLYSVTSTDTDVDFGLYAGTASNVSFSLSITVGTSYCLNVTHICVMVVPYLNYVDYDYNDNVQCFLVSSILTCKPGI